MGSWDRCSGSKLSKYPFSFAREAQAVFFPVMLNNHFAVVGK
jgi:hypothetical protein